MTNRLMRQFYLYIWRQCVASKGNLGMYKQVDMNKCDSSRKLVLVLLHFCVKQFCCVLVWKANGLIKLAQLSLRWIDLFGVWPELQDLCWDKIFLGFFFFLLIYDFFILKSTCMSNSKCSWSGLSYYYFFI